MQRHTCHRRRIDQRALHGRWCGGDQRALHALAISSGGHLSVRLEADANHPDEALRRNDAILGELLSLARDLGRDVATPTEARAILGLPRARQS